MTAGGMRATGGMEGTGETGEMVIPRIPRLAPTCAVGSSLRQGVPLAEKPPWR